MRVFPLTTDVDAATGFLVRDGASTWLVTCAHLLIGLRDQPPDWPKWRQTVMVHPENGAAFRIDLFDHGVPRFGWVLDGRSRKFVEDAIAIRLNEAQVAALKEYTPFLREAIQKAAVGETSICFGYPGIGTALTIRRPPSSLSGYVRQVEFNMVFSQFRSTAGFSGGPLLCGDKLVGVVSGNAFDPDGPAAAIDLFAIATDLFVEPPL